MSTIVTRAGKGSPLTHVEVDANFTNLNTDKVEKTSADITGGTINGTTIGATTPSSIVGTTITGQTGVLRGTGQNLIRYSEDLSNAVWVATSTTVATNTTTAPDGTLTADTLTATAPSATFQQTYNGVTGQVYTVSFYVKRKTGTGTISIRAVENLNTTIAVTTDWQRFSVTATSTSATIRAGIAITTSGDEVFVWGGQVEFASSAGTYVQTVASTIYGTPTLSFSGVSTLGLESNGALFLQPAGTGAIQAQATTSTTAGGNVRGANAVDWQTNRSAASQVASGSLATIGGGFGNTASGVQSVIAGGTLNSVTSTYNSIGGGISNTASSLFSVVVGGSTNTSAGIYNFIGAGFTNSGTSGSAVTTQSGTMNATTAVTLSGSNASIKVGQYITGTSIATDTYVSAISGTSLTLSKNASGSSTSTLSFYTPHGIVVGGGNNQATGSYSFIGGGGDGGTAANRNVASGDWSFVGGGQRNQATAYGAIVCGGADPFFGGANTASGQASAILGGAQNTSSGYQSAVLGGTANTASGAQSRASGLYATTRGIIGAFANGFNGFSSFSSGTCQYVNYLIFAGTTDATPKAVTADGNAAGSTNQVILPNNSAYLFKATVISGVTGGGNTSGWKLEGVIKRGANAASTAIVGSVTTTLLAQDAGASGWVIAATADTTNGGLRITFTGQASTTIRTVCKVETTEMTY